MKFLLVALNAKYIHSNPAVYSLKAYAEAHVKEPELKDGRFRIETQEYTINNQPDEILKDIYLRKPDAVGFSCYIWNISYVLELVRDLPKILPHVEIWLGGPEVSYDASRILCREPQVYGIMMGEGEETFSKVVRCYLKRGRENQESRSSSFEAVEGTAVRSEDGNVVEIAPKTTVDMSSIPFLYQDLKEFENRIIYYESSRGCPFSCSYCLSSLDKSVRLRDTALVLKELDVFLNNRVPQVKFVDRTFNCNRKHTMAIWRHIIEHDNGVTNFHFEISADLLNEEELEIMSRMRKGLIQLEIGVQSTNPDTIREIRRTMDLNRLKETVGRINRFGNIHQHLDLIAGLPWEDYQSFRNSFNEVYEMKPEQLQLGFLKVLKGSFLSEKAEEYGLKFKRKPPYEVLSTRWLDYGGILKLKGLEEMLEVYGNSGQFRTTLQELYKEFETPFDMFEALAEYYDKQELSGISHSRMARYEILERFILSQVPDKRSLYRDLLVYDLYLRENLKSRPPFAADQEPFKDQVRAFFEGEAASFGYLKEGYEGYEARQLIKMAHVEVFRDGRAVLFDYKKRDALSHNAAAYEIGIWRK
ncbi:B12-binding domain-containing radical SAM protein [Lacrimispora saccharolytica]|uniref:Radical SAM domain protein n=1 Tax=Lacrimispora saccharolytica (strain ATCC 35040 / DSM 2544 / NRCC 2533 / WM1) TaxID=610130 RepID=D9R2Z4_LACSW|nr:B12-binding domain-containing radical SAM protein [Lacrimispora saccharolytica]ADL02984.1 Radical SAM domain protein [[Clostridium] saccharolyticum WM1]QRV18830.1 B12-binding domain-containing radical SAM protein [Lacrimispora saccharolytica]